MSNDDRDALLVELRTRMEYVQRDLSEVKRSVSSERRDLGKIKQKIYTFSGVINGLTIAANLLFHLWTKLPQHTS